MKPSNLQQREEREPHGGTSYPTCQQPQAQESPGSGHRKEAHGGEPAGTLGRGPAPLAPTSVREQGSDLAPHTPWRHPSATRMKCEHFQRSRLRRCLREAYVPGHARGRSAGDRQQTRRAWGVRGACPECAEGREQHVRGVWKGVHLRTGSPRAAGCGPRASRWAAVNTEPASAPPAAAALPASLGPQWRLNPNKLMEPSRTRNGLGFSLSRLPERLRTTGLCLRPQTTR